MSLGNLLLITLSSKTILPYKSDINIIEYLVFFIDSIIDIIFQKSKDFAQKNRV